MTSPSPAPSKEAMAIACKCPCSTVLQRDIAAAIDRYAADRVTETMKKLSHLADAIKPLDFGLS